MSTFKRAKEPEDTRDQEQLDEGPLLIGVGQSNAAAAATAQRARTKRVQLKSVRAGTSPSGFSVPDIAARGMAGPATDFPYKAAIESSFGRAIPGQAHLDSNAAGACEALGAHGYASDGAAAFASNAPSLHTAAHEAAHLVQQTSGVRLKGEGSATDELEEHADDAASLVRWLVAGGKTLPADLADLLASHPRECDTILPAAHQWLGNVVVVQALDLLAASAQGRGELPMAGTPTTAEPMEAAQETLDSGGSTGDATTTDVGGTGSAHAGKPSMEAPTFAKPRRATRRRRRRRAPRRRRRHRRRVGRRPVRTVSIIASTRS